MPPRVYSDKEKARVYTVLTYNDGNVKRTARETGVPVATVRGWRDQWAKYGGPQAVLLEAVTDEVVGDFVEDAERIRDKALSVLEQKIEAGEITAKDLITTINTLTDKVRLIQGQATSRTEQLTSGPDPREFGAALVQYLERAAEMQELRAADIEDAEFEEAGPVRELPAAT
jgi:transposase-like protein